ncbi:MAG: AtpZ/AtpI family protein [Rhodospirillaceae bacterium]
MDRRPPFVEDAPAGGGVRLDIVVGETLGYADFEITLPVTVRGYILGSDNGPAGLKELEERVLQARQRVERTSWNAPEGEVADDKQKGMLSVAFRIGTEVLAALVVGVGGGLLIDNALGTKPWCLVVGFVLGACAGVSNVYRVLNGLGYAIGYRVVESEGERREETGAPPPAGHKD